MQTVAMIRLLLRGWYEPVCADKLHAPLLSSRYCPCSRSTAAPQCSNYGNCFAGPGRSSSVSQEPSSVTAAKLGEEEILFQDATGLLLLAPKGERITQHYSFYAAFSSDEEFRIVAGNPHSRVHARQSALGSREAS